MVAVVLMFVVVYALVDVFFVDVDDLLGCLVRREERGRGRVRGEFGSVVVCGMYSPSQTGPTATYIPPSHIPSLFHAA